MNWDKLSNAPIKEAVLHIRFKNPLSNDVITAFNQKVKVLYPIQNERFRFDIRIDNKNLGSNPTDSKSIKDGFRLLDDINKKLINITTQEISISKLEPYDSWKSLRADSIKILEILIETGGDLLTTRIALRYINRMLFPIEKPKTISNYFRLLPSIPKEMPTMLDGSNMRLMLPKPEKQLKSIINTSLKGIEGNVEIIFDIDVFKLTQKNNISDIFNELEDIRIYKNEIFFTCTTSELIKLYK